MAAGAPGPLRRPRRREKREVAGRGVADPLLAVGRWALGRRAIGSTAPVAFPFLRAKGKICQIPSSRHHQHVSPLPYPASPPAPAPRIELAATDAAAAPEAPTSAAATATARRGPLSGTLTAGQWLLADRDGLSTPPSEAVVTSTVCDCHRLLSCTTAVRVGQGGQDRASACSCPSSLPESFPAAPS